MIPHAVLWLTTWNPVTTGVSLMGGHQGSASLFLAKESRCRVEVIKTIWQSCVDVWPIFPVWPLMNLLWVQTTNQILMYCYEICSVFFHINPDFLLSFYPYVSGKLPKCFWGEQKFNHCFKFIYFCLDRWEAWRAFPLCWHLEHLSWPTMTWIGMSYKKYDMFISWIFVSMGTQNWRWMHTVSSNACGQSLTKWLTTVTWHKVLLES